MNFGDFPDGQVSKGCHVFLLKPFHRLVKVGRLALAGSNTSKNQFVGDLRFPFFVLPEGLLSVRYTSNMHV